MTYEALVKEYKQLILDFTQRNIDLFTKNTTISFVCDDREINNELNRINELINEYNMKLRNKLYLIQSLINRERMIL